MLKDIRENVIMLTDCYNLSHSRLKVSQDWEVSHMYNRAKGMILFGFKEIVTDILSTKVTMEMIDQAEGHAERMGLKFPREIWERVVNECEGYIPIRVESLQEGTYCPVGTPFAQIQNTVEGFGEMVTWFESQLMMAYFPSSCATRAFEMRKYLERKRDEFGYDDSFLWRYHSFGLRGHKSLEDAYFAGTAWNLFLQGTDDFHIANHMTEGFVMGSISALAHKVTQQFDDEFECFKHTIDATAESGEKIVAMVIDTYNAWNVINNMIVPLCEYAKDKGVHLVFRPDSGDIFEQAVAIHKIAEENQLTNCSVIIGEGMSFEVAKEYDEKFLDYGVPLNFIAYGIGAGFYKDIDRDYLGWAMKTAFSNGKPRMKVVKSNPFKQSIPNIIHLVYENGEMVVNDSIPQDGEEDLYEVIYKHLSDREVSTMKVYKHMGAMDSVIDDRIFCEKVDSKHFVNVRDLALTQDTSQGRIKLSEKTQLLIKEFQDKYNN